MIMVNVMMTMTVVVSYETSQDICAGLENSPRHAGYPASDIYSVFGEFAMRQYLSATNVKTHPIQDTLATLSSFSNYIGP